MASIRKRGSSYQVRWRDPDGQARSRSCPTREAAEALARDVERTVALGRRWRPQDELPVPRLTEALSAYIAWAEVRRAPGTVRVYDLSLGQFFDWLTARQPRRALTLEDVTDEAADAWYASLVARGLKRSTCNLRATALHSARTWLYDHERFGRWTPRPRRRLHLPPVEWSPPTAATWEELDALIVTTERLAGSHARSDVRRQLGWRARLFVVLRATGLRVTQAMHLEWGDVDLDTGWLTIRGELGKSRQERSGRVVPLAPCLVEELAGWGARDGFLIAPWKTDRAAQSMRTRRLWKAAGVRPEVWDGHAHHAIRRAFETNLKRAGADTEAVEYLVGHSIPGARGHYLDPRRALDLTEAVKLVPPVARSRAVLRLERLGDG